MECVAVYCGEGKGQGDALQCCHSVELRCECGDGFEVSELGEMLYGSVVSEGVKCFFVGDRCHFGEGNDMVVVSVECVACVSRIFVNECYSLFYGAHVWRDAYDMHVVSIVGCSREEVLVLEQFINTCSPHWCDDSHIRVYFKVDVVVGWSIQCPVEIARIEGSHCIHSQQIVVFWRCEG